MNSGAGPRGRLVRPLGERDRVALDVLLGRGGPADAFLADAATDPTPPALRGFLGCFDGSVLVGALRMRDGSVCAAAATPPDVARALARGIPRRYRWSSVVGPEEPCAVVKEVLSGAAVPRVDRVQVFMWMGRRDPVAEGHPDLRPALPSDLDALVPVVAAYRREDGLSPDSVGPTAWLRRYVAERIEEGHVHVVEEAGRIVFTGSFNFLGPRGAGLGGIYTVPAARGRGLATAGTAGLARMALSCAPVVNLHVNRTNGPALRCYENVGLRREGFFRLAFR